MFMCYPICVTCVTFCFCLILALLKPLKNQRVSDFFRGYRKRPVVWNELKSRSDEPLLQFVEIETRFNSHYIKKCPYKKWKDGCQFFLLFNSTVNLAFSGVEIFSLFFKKKLYMFSIMKYQVWKLSSFFENHTEAIRCSQISIYSLLRIHCILLTTLQMSEIAYEVVCFDI